MAEYQGEYHTESSRQRFLGYLLKYTDLVCVFLTYSMNTLCICFSSAEHIFPDAFLLVWLLASLFFNQVLPQALGYRSVKMRLGSSSEQPKRLVYMDKRTASFIVECYVSSSKFVV